MLEKMVEKEILHTEWYNFVLTIWNVLQKSTISGIQPEEIGLTLIILFVLLLTYSLDSPEVLKSLLSSSEQILRNLQSSPKLVSEWSSIGHCKEVFDVLLN